MKIPFPQPQSGAPNPLLVEIHIFIKVAYPLATEDNAGVPN
jgi:hypothetical protein